MLTAAIPYQERAAAKMKAHVRRLEANLRNLIPSQLRALIDQYAQLRRVGPAGRDQTWTSSGTSPRHTSHATPPKVTDSPPPRNCTASLNETRRSCSRLTR